MIYIKSLINAVFLAAIGLTLVGISYSYFPSHYVNPELKERVDQTVDTIRANCKEKDYFYPAHTSVTFQDLPIGIAGLCTRYVNRWTITFDTKFWSWATEGQKDLLVRHELSHCMLYAEHRNAPPTHYMNPAVADLSEDEQINQLMKVIGDQCHE